MAVCAPLFLEDAEVRAQAARLWRCVQDAPLSDAIRDTLVDVLEFWLFERFKTLSAEEILAMLNQLTPLEETRAYQAIFAKGEAKGKAEGKGEDLQRLLTRRFGPLPAWAQARIARADMAQLDVWLDGILDTPSLEALIGDAAD